MVINTRRVHIAKGYNIPLGCVHVCDSESAHLDTMALRLQYG